METDLEQADRLLDAAVAALGEAADDLGDARARLDDATRRAELRATRVARRVTITGDPLHDGLDLDALTAAPAATPPAPPAGRDAAVAFDGAQPRRYRFPKSVRVVAGTALGLAGAAVLADAVLTWTWQEPVSALKAGQEQSKLGASLDEVTRSMQASDKKFEAAIRGKQLDRARQLKLLQARRTAAATAALRLKPGQPLGRLVIPRIGVDKVLVQGTAPAQLSEALGHYVDTKLPGLSGPIGIAGHRTTHGAPFRHIDRLKVGDPISLKTVYGTYVYRVIGKKIVSPDDAWVLRRGGDRKRLVLTACHPLFSAKQRYVVTAQLDHGPRSNA